MELFAQIWLNLVFPIFGFIFAGGFISLAIYQEILNSRRDARERAELKRSRELAAAEL